MVKPVCPSCRRPLERRRGPLGLVYACPTCEGRMVGMGVLRRERTRRSFLKSLWGRARKEGQTADRDCPHCVRPMVPVAMPPAEGALALDVCLRCQAVWFDPGEHRAVSREPPREIEKPKLSPEAAKAIVELAATSDEADVDPEAPEEPWKILPAAFGLPVETERPALSIRPWATWLTAAALAIVYLITAGDLDETIRGAGFRPEDWSRAAGLTLLSSFFLHGGVWHLVGNLYFFLVFGDDVEDRLGPGRLLLLLFLSHIAGVLLHAAFDPNPGVPLVGASAGIVGIVGYYAIATPRARVAFLFVLPWRVGWVRMPALSLLLLYVFLQILGAWQQVHGFTNTSALGHLGGLLVGIVAALAPRIVDPLEEKS